VHYIDDGSAYRLRVASRQPLDLILLDLQMPVMDGFQVIEALKENETDGSYDLKVWN
jgi:CheY-like chemotaxis protein